MQISLSSILEHLETTASLQDIVDRFLQLGFEVEGVQNPLESLKDFVVGHVVLCERHPHAERLSLCQVDVGGGSIKQVVCGAPNVHKGMFCVFAPIGSVIPSTNAPLKLSKIRGVESQGMLCSETELGLGKESDGIMVLMGDLVPGQPLSSALRLDSQIDLSITPNRSDCLTPYGLARDLAASGLGILKDKKSDAKHNFHIVFPFHKTLTHGGIDLSLEQMECFLLNIGCDVEKRDDHFCVTPPLFRKDLDCSEDLVEEILRLHGYDKIKAQSLPVKLALPLLPPSELAIRRYLTSRGLNEIYSYSLVCKEEALLFGDPLTVQESKSMDFYALRPSVLIGGLKALSFNQRRFLNNLGFFEVAYEYSSKEIPVVSCVLSQNIIEKSWSHCEQKISLFHAKDIVYGLCDLLGITAHVRESDYPFYHPTRQGNLLQGKRIIGHFGEIHPKVQDFFGLKGPVVGLTFYRNSVGSLKKKAFVSYPYPFVVRDFCFVLNQSTPAEHLLQVIAQSVKPKSILIYDQVILKDDKKSITLQVTFQDPTKTLSEDEILSFYNKVIDVVQKECKSELKMK